MAAHPNRGRIDTMSVQLSTSPRGSVPIHEHGCRLCSPGRGTAAATRRWLKTVGFAAAPDRHALVPGADGKPAGRVGRRAQRRRPLGAGGAAAGLPEGDYHLAEGRPWRWTTAPPRCPGNSGQLPLRPVQGRCARSPRSCTWPAARTQRALIIAAAMASTRDLVNTPAEHLGPAELAEAVRLVARQHGATFKQTVGDKLLRPAFPAVHAVGRAAARAPRLIELNWGKPRHPRVTLVGKGVCFDSGGLDIKGADGMRLMKKDMGGAANALGLAQMIMALQLPCGCNC
jgi:leucyl aminopeptidase